MPFNNIKNKLLLNLGELSPVSIIQRTILLCATVLFVVSIYDIGYSSVHDTASLYRNPVFRIVFPLVAVLYIIRSVFFTNRQLNRKVFIANSLLGILLILIFMYRVTGGETLIFKPLFHNFTILHFLAFILIILEFSRLKIEMAINILNPAQLFIVSFTFIILAGSFLLLMPESTSSPVTFTEAVFTSTSAVCVTGLTVVDTATRFTPLGRLIILGLIQVGGIGVMTITSFFGFFFKETSSFREQMLIRDYLSEDSYSGILRTLIKIILIVFSIELVGAMLIFYSLYISGLHSVTENIRFSVFHSVSAFCNAGFSSFSDNLYDIRIRENYQLQFWIANLIILGGLGFPVFLNLHSYIKAQFIWLKEFFKYGKPYEHRVGLITFHTKLVVLTTLLLLIFGTAAIYFLESEATLKGAGFGQKLATSWFMSVTPRTAGFNTVNMDMLARPTLLIIMFLMWIGASPVSTGGGIKTSTFIISVLNVIRLIRGKNHIEVLKREIHEFSVNKAFAIVFISILIISAGIFTIFLFDGDKGLLKIAFECFSAFGTVGLSINLTPFLSVGSKWVLIALMFLGRMGIVTLLLSMSVGTEKNVVYRYPKENIIIT